MADISDLNRYRMQRGASMFLSCTCGGNEFLAVCVASGPTPVISALLCPECEQELPVGWGRVES